MNYINTLFHPAPHYLPPLPDELIGAIQKQLPFPTQNFVIPLVSKRWKRISEENKPYVRTGLRCIAETYPTMDHTYPTKYSWDQRMKLFNFLENNSLVSEILKLEIGFKGTGDLDNPLFTKGMGIHFTSQSDTFPVNWNKKLNLKKDGKMHEERSWVYLALKHSILDKKNSHVTYAPYTPISTIQVGFTSTTQVKHIYGWGHKSCCYMTYIVWHAVHCELNLHVSLKANENVKYFSNVKKIDDLSPKSLFAIDYFGRILETNPQNSPLNFTILKLEDKNKRFYLKWETNDLDDTIEKRFIKGQHDIPQTIRWDVLSSTVKNLALQLGLLN